MMETDFDMDFPHVKQIGWTNRRSGGRILSGRAVRHMDIGSKIRRARINANLTQEQAAEALGVSRQTISNWENDLSHS